MTGGLRSPHGTTMTASWQHLVGGRRSCRNFLPDPLDAVTLCEVFAEALTAPSNCNTQPWNVHVVSGDARDRMAAALLAADAEGVASRDFDFDANAYTGV